MSALGTGVAAGVAQSARQAERLGRNADRAESQATQATRSQRHLFQIQLNRTRETPLADEYNPDHPPPGYEHLYDQSGEHPAEEVHAQETATTPPPDDFDPDQLHLYTSQGEQTPLLIHHVDFEA